MPDHDLTVGESDPTIDVLEGVRCIIAATTMKGGQVDLFEVASQTGMTIEQVRRLVRSPTYADVLAQEAMSVISHALVRGLRKMDDMVHGAKTKDMAKIMAFKAIQQTYSALRGSKAEKSQDDPDEEFAKWRERRALRRPKQPE